MGNIAHPTGRSPVVGTLLDVASRQKVDEGANLGLGKAARRVDGVDALHFGWMARDRLFCWFERMLTSNLQS